MFARTLAIAVSLTFASSVIAQDKPREPGLRLPGMQASGQMLLPTQWSLKPAVSKWLWATFQ